MSDMKLIIENWNKAMLAEDELPAENKSAIFKKYLKMAIKIKIEKAKEATVVQLEMDIRKSLNGDLMIFDHGDIDIVLSTANNKVVAFLKKP